MIKQEIFNINEHTTLIKHYSDNGKMIIQHPTGIMFVTATDVYPTNFTYSQSNIGVPSCDNIQ